MSTVSDQARVKSAVPIDSTIEQTQYQFIDASQLDVSLLTELLQKGVRAGNEEFGQHRYLEGLIKKPWGEEYRAYCDDFLDIWHLRINPGQSTSMHAHPRKTTYLICLSGSGITTTLNGATPLRKGMILRIARGAFHATKCDAGVEPLMLIEVESPRNKFDLVRSQDNYHRAGRAYETVSDDLPAVRIRVQHIPHAMMCKASPCTSLEFNVLRGMDVFYRRRSVGEFLIPLDLDGLLFDQMTILTDRLDENIQPSLDISYFCIKSSAPSERTN